MHIFTEFSLFLYGINAIFYGVKASKSFSFEGLNGG